MNFEIVSDDTLLPLTRFAPKICLLDIDSLHNITKTELIAAIKDYPQVRFMVLVSIPEQLDGVEWIRAGARGYVNRLINTPVLEASIEAIQGGEIWAGKLVVQFLLTQLQQAATQQQANKLDLLTQREHELALYVGNGLNNKKIAVKLGITERTVKAHLNNIFKKLGITSRVQLALAIEQEKTPNSQKNAWV
jgi:DNA-binding NarL/FixJ family response regulator